MTIRTRFAPSPTGSVHIGNMRAAIYNWLFARHAGGKFLLRVEDTDQERSTPAAVKTVLDAMEWLGLSYDEEPLYQSTRKTAHLAAAERLLQSGHAYKLDKGGTGKGEAILFKMPGRDMGFHDQIKGVLRKEAKDMQDFVIVRSDGHPVFHLANVVDDIDMGITHVIRGDDHVENTYRHVALFEALGSPVPLYAHLPMIVNAQGKPYSKRDGDAFVGDFRDKGYLPEALFNYLVLLGWSPGDDQEVMSKDTMVSLFDLQRVKSNAAQFDMKKFQWMNAEYMKQTPEPEYGARLQAAMRDRGCTDRLDQADYVRQVIPLLRERVKLWPELGPMAAYFFTEDFTLEPELVEKRLKKPGANELLAELAQRYEAAAEWTAASTEAALRTLANERTINASELIHPLRVALSGVGGGPSLFHMMEVLGRDRCIARVKRVLSAV